MPYAMESDPAGEGLIELSKYNVEHNLADTAGTAAASAGVDLQARQQMLFRHGRACRRCVRQMLRRSLSALAVPVLRNSGRSTFQRKELCAVANGRLCPALPAETASTMSVSMLLSACVRSRRCSSGRCWAAPSR